MQTEWSPDSDDTPAPPVGAAPWAQPGRAPVGGEPAEVEPGPAVVSPGVDGVVDTRDVEPGTVGGDGEVPEGEVPDEDLHRSAVDAVDRLLDEVELALTRLDDGTYGRCETCGTPIDDDRLAGLPIVRTCARCDGVTAPSAPDPVEPVPA